MASKAKPAQAAPSDALLEAFHWLTISRVMDRALCELNPRWFPSEGEEATIVGSFLGLRPTDIAAPHYRGPFVVYLMRGAELWRLMAQAMGKPAGYNGGRSVPFTGPVSLNIVPWVAGDLGTSIGIATGAALALQTSETDGVAVCSFGDGTANRGDFHENLNLAAVWRLPIIYVCQNNGWAISQRAGDYLPSPIAARAAGYGMPGISVDGQDFEAVKSAVDECIERARRGMGPSLIEARTARFRGHWAADTASYRAGDDVPGAPDPLDVVRSRLTSRGKATKAELDLIFHRAELAVAEAVKVAAALPEVTEADLGTNEVYVS